MFTTFIEGHLKVAIPEAFKEEFAMNGFIKKRILSLRRPKKNDERLDTLVHSDLRQLQSTFVKQFVTLQDAFVHAVRVAQNLIKLRQSIFEPIFMHFRSADGYLSLTGSFYQSLLFISKCNVATTFVDVSE